MVGARSVVHYERNTLTFARAMGSTPGSPGNSQSASCRVALGRHRCVTPAVVAAVIMSTWVGATAPTAFCAMFRGPGAAAIYVAAVIMSTWVSATAPTAFGAMCRGPASATRSRGHNAATSNGHLAGSTANIWTRGRYVVVRTTVDLLLQS